MSRAQVTITGFYEMIDADYESEHLVWQIEEDRQALDKGVIGIADLLEWCEGGLEISIQLVEDEK